MAVCVFFIFLYSHSSQPAGCAVSQCYWLHQHQHLSYAVSRLLIGVHTHACKFPHGLAKELAVGQPAMCSNCMCQARSVDLKLDLQSGSSE